MLQSINQNFDLQYNANARIRYLAGTPELLPFAAHALEPSYWADAFDAIDTWKMHHLPNPRLYNLHSDKIPEAVSQAQSPLLTTQDFELTAEVIYDNEVPSWTYDGMTTTLTDTIMLCKCLKPQSGDMLQQRSFEDGKVFIQTSFYWPPEPTGPVAGYTHPLSSWVETIIEGFTTEPIILHGWYSQTYRPEHHNFFEHFMFEPRLEPGISENILAELAAKNIRLFHLMSAPVGATPELTTFGFDEVTFLEGDINRDKVVDITDVRLFAYRWLDSICDDCSRADMTGDGNVRIDDYVEIASNWLREI